MVVAGSRLGNELGERGQTEGVIMGDTGRVYRFEFNNISPPRFTATLHQQILDHHTQLHTPPQGWS